ncbi:MAG: hypothetical protein ACODAJ_05825 [Planctomycetota bacterium]
MSAITLVELVYLTERGRVPDEALARLKRAAGDNKQGVQIVPVDRRMAEAAFRRHVLGPWTPPYACDGALVYRLAADHYFLINDGEAKEVTLDTGAYRYASAADAVTGEPLPLGAPIVLDAHSGRWLRLAR